MPAIPIPIQSCHEMSRLAPVSAPAGRPRDTDLDHAIVTATQRLLGEVGYEALSIAAVAERAGTTRPAVYRRYGDKAGLAIAAISALATALSPEPGDDAFEDLVAELSSFRKGITGVNGLALAAVALSDATDEGVRSAYQAEVVAPRRARIGAIIERAADDGTLRAEAADRRVAVTMCTGSWYAFALAGETPPRDWPRRTATLIWRALS